MNPVAVGRFRPATPGGRPVNWAATGRLGGVSTGNFAQLNLSLTVGDTVSAVLQNRELAGQMLGVADVCVLDAQHDARVAFAVHGGIAEGADAVVTNVAGLGLLALAADCVPIVLADPSAPVVAAVHCGWRGLGLGVVTAAIDVMRKHGATRISAVTGPSICVDCYPVGIDCVSELKAQLSSELFAACAFDRSGQWHIDVRAGVHAQLRRHGVSTSAIDRCTATDPQLFSHRADGATGRQGMIVTL
ncbi:MAG: polyphenol oxidase family protein [Actinomycetota bacterium]|nr:polyphenol oxidase family protein [Actinomycetota bacterium]MDP2288992.1 polyphenol oxidase family protein [Actinomycetota bacterium]